MRLTWPGLKPAVAHREGRPEGEDGRVAEVHEEPEEGYDHEIASVFLVEDLGPRGLVGLGGAVSA